MIRLFSIYMYERRCKTRIYLSSNVILGSFLLTTNSPGLTASRCHYRFSNVTWWFRCLRRYIWTPWVKVIRHVHDDEALNMKRISTHVVTCAYTLFSFTHINAVTFCTIHVIVFPYAIQLYLYNIPLSASIFFLYLEKLKGHGHDFGIKFFMFAMLGTIYLCL